MTKSTQKTSPYTHYVLFLDILGFASLVDGLSQRDQKQLARSIHFSTKGKMGTKAARLYRQYNKFHDAIRQYRDDHSTYVQQSKRAIPLDVIAFSDSAFLVFEDAGRLAIAAKSIMKRMYEATIPVRGGIGAGYFHRLAFSITDSPAGDTYITSPFIGSAVVRAYKAESCGLKGMRIFVHPSAVKDLYYEHEACLPLPEVEKKALRAKHTKRTKLPATHEMMVYDEYDPVFDNLEKRDLFLKYAEMFYHIDKSPKAVEQFDPTIEAIERMLSFDGNPWPDDP